MDTPTTDLAIELIVRLAHVGLPRQNSNAQRPHLSELLTNVEITDRAATLYAANLISGLDWDASLTQAAITLRDNLADTI